MNEQKLKAAIAYLGDTIRETDEIMPECFPSLQAELTEQRGHYVVAIEAMQSSLPNNKALTVEELREMNGQPVWCSELECHGIIAVDSSGRWKDMPFLCGRWEQLDFKYDIGSRGLTLYRRPPEKGET